MSSELLNNETNKNIESNDDNDVVNSENDGQNNREDNEESNHDIFRVLYGDDQNDGTDEDVDDHNYYYNDDEEEEAIGNNANASVDEDMIEDRRSNVMMTTNESQQNRTASNSKKRHSTEDDASQAKRVKPEPMSPKRNNDANESIAGKRLTTTCEPVYCDEESSVEIPKTSQEFMMHILDWDPNCLESNKTVQIPMAENLKDISNVLHFKDFDTFRNIFIPSIIVNLWEQVRREYTLKHNNKSKTNETIHFYSILTKVKSNKMKNGLEMKCISFRKVNESPVFRFGQLVILRTAVQLKPNSNAHHITRKSHLGYVFSHVIRKYNQQNQSEVNHLRLLNEDKRESVLVEEIIFLTKFSDELYLRNDALIVAEPLLCIHSYHLQARAIFKFEQFPLCRQILNPIFNSKASGVLVSVNETKSKFDNLQLECIQVGLDVVANPSSAYSCFLAVNGPKSCGKTALLVEIVKQIVRSVQFRQMKVLFTSSNDKCLNNVNELLRKHRINTFLIEKDFSLTLIRSAIKHIQHKLTKDVIINDSKKKKLYEECLEYFESDMDHELSVESTLFKNEICEQVRHDLMNQSNVIISRIDDMCNDIASYKYFANRDAFSCCIIDDSASISEPQLYSLFWFGIKKFILAANLGDKNYSDDSEICKRMGLSRSFFNRYCSLCPQNSNDTTTVFNF